MLPLRTRVPFPPFVSPKLLPPSPITPPTVRVFPLTVTTVLLPPSITAPVPRLRLLEPVNVKFAFQLCELLVERVMLEPDVLSIALAAEIVKLPVPRAEALFIFNVPPLRVVPPEYVFAPESVRAPRPAFVRLKPLPLIAPPTIRVLVSPFVVIWRLAVRITVPVPRFRLFVPAVPSKAKSPPQIWLLLLPNVIALPLVLAMVPLLIVTVPVPGAVALLILRVPAERVRPPPKVLAPDNVNGPLPVLVIE